MLPLTAALLAACVLDRTGQSATEAYRRDLATHGAQIQALNEAADKADARLGQLEELTRARGEDEILKMDTMEQVRTEVANLRNEVEVLNHDYRQTSQQSGAQSADLQFRLDWLETRAETLEKSLGLKTPPPPNAAASALGVGNAVTSATPAVQNPPDAAGTAAPVTATPVQTETVANDPDSLLKLAEEHLAAGREEAAEAVLNRFLKEYPKHERVPEATYRLAEAKFNAKNYPSAVIAFQKVIDDYKDSPWAAWAMLRQGECFEAQGQAKNAKIFYEDTMRLYPKSKAAKEAKDKLGK